MKHQMEQRIWNVWRTVFGGVCLFLIILSLGWTLWFQPLMKQQHDELSKLEHTMDHDFATMSRLKNQVNTTRDELVKKDAKVQNLTEIIEKMEKADLERNKQLQSMKQLKDIQEQQKKALADQLSNAATQQQQLKDDIVETRKRVDSLKGDNVIGVLGTSFLFMVCCALIAAVSGGSQARARERSPELRESLLP